MPTKHETKRFIEFTKLVTKGDGEQFRKEIGSYLDIDEFLSFLAVLFSGRVADNIANSRPWATDEEIEAAARTAHAHEFIMRLPEGYDTLVGERGMTLSGGERQRIAIARAFLKDAPILLLDEPTSAVDVQTEAGILDAMEDLMRGRTSIIITHRLSPLSACDTVLVLEQGQLVTTSPAWATGNCEPLRVQVQGDHSDQTLSVRQVPH